MVADAAPGALIALVVATVGAHRRRRVIRVELLAGPEAFYLVIAAVLVPLGAWLAVARQPEPSGTPARRLAAIALAVGVVGGIHGIVGGSILAGVVGGG
jgi:uncharacterized protein